MKVFWSVMVMISALSIIVHEPWGAVMQFVSFFLSAGVMAWQAYAMLPLQKDDVPEFLFYAAGTILFMMNVLYFAFPAFSETAMPNIALALAGLGAGVFAARLILGRVMKGAND